jgi:branched-chain amino acid transport system ATP-binding protein
MLLELVAVNAFYGRAHILFDLSLAVDRGEVVALLGRNGAGKSTTIKAVIGLVRPASGRVLYAGRDIARLPVHEIARLGIGYVPEERRVFAELTVRENLTVGRQDRRAGAPFWDEERLFALFPKLAELRDRRAGLLSGGEQQMLTIARTLMGNPDILLLDEPSEGLAPIIVQHIAEMIRRLRGMGVTILLAEQNMHFCLGVASHATIIDKGQVVYRDTIESLRADDGVKRRYLAM